ncbi:autotransporter domain-containing protein [Caulobacter sp. 1776]|uniref:autotransporter domain-containing protein n=1 Tax=Caulobacter sp. 1776 TaxID=3156420 RepID=UPI0033958AB1
MSLFHRTGARAPATGRVLLSGAILAILAPATLLASQEAQAAEPPKPSRAFGDTVLTDGNDDVTNNKTVDLTEDVDFGDGSDALTNDSVITIGAKATAPVHVSILSLDALKNKGLIDLRNGRGGDVLTLSGDYNGTGKARLGLDVGPDGVDRLIVGDVANGKTAVVLGGLSAQTAVLTGDKGPVLIQAAAGSTADAFSIENDEIGFIHYGLAFDAQAATYRLNGVAGRRAYDALKISEGAANVWRQSADAWSAHVANLRDAGADAVGAGVWGQAHGGWQDRNDKVAASGRVVRTDYQQTSYGGQMGADLINAEMDDERILIGVTGGYAAARLRFDGVAQDVKLSAVNVGGYVALARGSYFLNALAKVDRQSIKVLGEADAVAADFDGTSYGAQIEAGSRSEGDGMAYEKLLSINYVSTRLDDMKAYAQRLDFDNATGFVAKVGLRGSMQGELLGGALTSYGAAFVVHDFTVKSGLTLVSGDQKQHLSDDGGRTFGQITAGMSFRAAGAMITFLEASGDFGGGRNGGTLRLGARIGF